MSDSDVKAPGAQTETTLGQDLRRLARYWLGGRWALLVAGALAAAGGLAPLVAGVLPCLAMCAAGLCMKGLGGRAGDASGAKEHTTAERAGSTALPPSDEADSVIAQPSEAPAKSSPAAVREEGAESSPAGGEGVPAESPHASSRNVNP